MAIVGDDIKIVDIVGNMIKTEHNAGNYINSINVGNERLKLCVLWEIRDQNCWYCRK